MVHVQKVLDKLRTFYNTVEKKNEKKATKSRLDMYIRNESRAIVQQYLQLGKYYYENKRESKDENHNRLCNSIDKSKRIIEEAKMELSNLYL